VAERLRNAKFKPDETEEGKPTRQRWRISDPPVTVDFLIEPETGAEADAGRLFPLTKDLSAIIAPGLHLAFRNNRKITLKGKTIVGEAAEREICVCGAGAFVVLKALAFHIRGENKDAYDLFYLLRNYGRGVSDVATELRPLLTDASAARAMDYLRTDFQASHCVGQMRTAEFLYGRLDPATQADAAGFVRQLFTEWIPALGDVEASLKSGARAADVGCGHGCSTTILARAFPNSEFVGYDVHRPSIERARGAAKRLSLPNVHFEVATAKDYPGHDYDLVTFFDCLHDMGDPAGVAAHFHRTLHKDGTWMTVEPLAGNTLAENLNPVGRLYYAFSAMVCTPASRSQEVGLSLGAQAGEARLREVVCKGGGFTRFRRATETPFNLILEARH
jgi:2-polyprenyl-3-methyl-5-hydroxy-6-metoxy-1,4-benzoquinol methylase